VIAARKLLAAGKRVAIFDFDAHHGDGTENLTKSDDNILSYSVHHYGIFPGTGAGSEPEHHVYNKPLNAMAGDDELFAASDEFIEVARAFEADFIFVAAGADGHINDPLGGLAYTTDGAERAMRNVRNAFSATPILMGGAGGYRPDDDTPAMWSSAFAGLTSGRSSLA
jgi:acetoin utilization deacetylase AcuC-like enzyme